MNIVVQALSNILMVAKSEDSSSNHCIKVKVGCIEIKMDIIITIFYK
jgi:hypothetical protein